MISIHSTTFIVIFVTINTIQSAIFYCDEFAPLQLKCRTNELSSANEPILIAGQPNNYINRNITAISISSFNPDPFVMAFIPRNLFKIYPNLESVTVYSVSVKFVDKNAIVDCKKLTEFFLSANNFPEIPDSFLSNCKEVRELQMRENGIKSIHKNALNGLKNLKNLDLSANKIACIPSNLFESTPQTITINR